jgi:hypothetical protein
MDPTWLRELHRRDREANPELSKRTTACASDKDVQESPENGMERRFEAHIEAHEGGLMFDIGDELHDLAVALLKEAGWLPKPHEHRFIEHLDSDRGRYVRCRCGAARATDFADAEAVATAAVMTKNHEQHVRRS